jgi:hypothetical protein
MDAFGRWIDNYWQLTLHDRRVLTEKQKAICICGECPGYNRCARESGESVYCITGKSPRCISDDRGCTCNKCPLTAEIGLSYHDFCMKGSEAVQRYEHELH